MNFKKAYSPAWEYYIAKDSEYDFKEEQCGSWRYYFDASKESLAFVRKICEQAILEGVVAEIKHSNEEAMKIKGSGLCCFYCNGDDEDTHKKVIAFFIQNNMLLRDDYGNLRNMAFKYDSTAKRGKKGSVPVQLGDFVNLKTGEFKARNGEDL